MTVMIMMTTTTTMMMMMMMMVMLDLWPSINIGLYRNIYVDHELFYLCTMVLCLQAIT